jgi:hypothetical protein
MIVARDKLAKIAENLAVSKNLLKMRAATLIEKLFEHKNGSNLAQFLSHTVIRR